jgi:hypothetical protein
MTTREATSKRFNLNLNLDRLDILVLGVLSGLFLGAVGASLYFHFRTSLPDLADWLDSVLQNTGTEMFGAVLTFYLIEVMLRKRREGDAERRATAREKRRLILQMGSPNNTFAVEAARILWARDWGYGKDASLCGAILDKANLQGATLVKVNLEEAVLIEANLQEADLNVATLEAANLIRANLQKADLTQANLREAYLEEANLQEADLEMADLEEARLLEANLQGANLAGANLAMANLSEANLAGASLRATGLDEDTTLPDDSRWTPDTDMARFTDSDHPDFWRSSWRDSPAYRGDEDDD